MSSPSRVSEAVAVTPLESPENAAMATAAPAQWRTIEASANAVARIDEILGAPTDTFS